MMNNFDITAIEDEVREIVRNLKVSTKVYANRPKATESASDFIVVSASGGVDDLACYGECVIAISLFAKDNDHFKNGKKLSVMYNKLIEGFPASSGRLLFDTEPNVLGDTPDDYGYHARIIRFKVTIKAI